MLFSSNPQFFVYSETIILIDQDTGQELFEKGEDKYLEADGGKRRGHTAVERGGALAGDDAAEEADSRGGSSDEGGDIRGSGRRRLLQPDAEGVERVARDDPGHAADAPGHELPPPASRQELRPELHDLLSHNHAHLPLALKNTTLHAQRGGVDPETYRGGSFARSIAYLYPKTGEDGA